MRKHRLSLFAEPWRLVLFLLLVLNAPLRGQVAACVPDPDMVRRFKLPSPEAGLTYTLGLPRRSAFGMKGYYLDDYNLDGNRLGSCYLDFRNFGNLTAPLSLPVRSLAASGAAASSGTSASPGASADLNGDGIPDSVVLRGTPQIAVYLANADGTLGPRVSYPVGSTPSSVTIADLNGDGKPDLVVTNFDAPNSNYVSVLLGNGDGTFQPARNLAVGKYPMSAAVADFNGDGKPDLAVAASDGLYLMLANADGTFQAPVKLFTGTGGLSVVAADFNGDGKIDLALGQFATDTSGGLVTLLGNGNGTFQAPVTTNAGEGNSEFLAFADFNGDGKLDLAVGHASTNSISILPGNGDGTFRSGNTYLAGASPTSFSMLDLDGDGNLDFAVLDATSALLLQVILGNGDGTFQAPPYYGVPGSNSRNPVAVSSLAVADFNGDGRLDVVTSDGSIWLGKGNGQFAPGSSKITRGTFVLAADFNGDGKPDLATSSGVALGNGDGSFRSASPYPAGATARYFAAGDLNGDGKLDLVVAPYNPSDVLSSPAAANVSVLLGNGDGTFRPPTIPLSGVRAFAVALGDFNGDGKLDLAVVDHGVFQGVTLDPGSIRILLGNGDGTFTAAPQLTAGKNPTHLALADINRDGKLDLVVATTSDGINGALAVFLGKGDGTFLPQPLIATAPNPVQWVAVLDLNGDGKPDILESEQNADVGFFAGNGDGTFQGEVPFPAGPNPVQIVAADFNGDGKPDLAVADNNFGSGGGGWTALLNNFGSSPAPSISQNVSAASSTITSVAPASIATIFGANLATGTGVPSGTPPPTTFQGTSVTITDSKGTQQAAPLFYVSPGQVNYLVPSGTAFGAAQVTVTNGGLQGSASAQIANVAPGIFQLNSSGLAAAGVLVVAPDGSQSLQNVYQLDSSNNVIALPIDLRGAAVYLELYGTGIRNATRVTATVGGQNVPVLSAGAQGTFPGLDQVNIGPLPQSLQGAGQARIVFTADGQTANSVNVTIK